MNYIKPNVFLHFGNIYFWWGWQIGVYRSVGVYRRRIRRILQKTVYGLGRGEHCSPAPRTFRKIGICRDVRGACLLAEQLQCPYLLKEILRISLRPTRS